MTANDSCAGGAFKSKPVDSIIGYVVLLREGQRVRAGGVAPRAEARQVFVFNYGLPGRPPSVN